MIMEKKNIRGFSLIELLVSIALLAILAIGFIPLMTNSYTGIYVSGEKNKAIDLAQKEIEQLFTNGTTIEDKISIEFINGGNTTEFEISGEYVNIEKTYDNGKSVTFDVFIPKQ